MSKLKLIVASLALFSGAAVATTVVVVDEPEIVNFTINGGGGTSTGGDYQLFGSIGQTLTGTLTGGSYSLEGGFLHSSSCNADGVFNLADYISLEACMAGPSGGLISSGCNCYDFDNDQSVDLRDVAELQVVFNGG